MGSEPIHLRLYTAAAGLETSVARETAVAAVQRFAARHSAVVLAFAVVPDGIDLLLAADSLPANPATALSQTVSRAVNQVTGGVGGLFAVRRADLVEGDESAVLAAAEAIEAKPVVAGLVDEPGDWWASSAHGEHAEWLREAPPAAPAGMAASPVPPLSEGAPATTIGEVIDVAQVPRVVSLAQVDSLAERFRSGDEPTPDDLAALQGFVGGWFLTEAKTRHAVETLLAGLGDPVHGGGWFVAGLYGAGKSHLLAALRLLVQFPVARRIFAESHPDQAGLVAGWDQRPRLVVPVALDELSVRTSLEDLVFSAASDALAAVTGCREPLAEPDHVVAVAREHLLPRYREGLAAAAGEDWEPLADRDAVAAAGAAWRLVSRENLPISFAQTRVERLGRLLELAAMAGLVGVVFLLDELSLHLGGRYHAGVQADAAFLQFLGQRAATSPVWVIGTVQKQIEEAGEIPVYSLRQIKDRYETRLALPLAEARAVVSGKVLPRRSPAAVEQAVATCLAHWDPPSRGDLTRPKLLATWPLHPLTFDCLEACAERFLAQTRSVIDFAARRVGGDEFGPGILDQPVTRLLMPDELWEHFEPELVHHPDLRPYQELVGGWYRRNLRQLTGDDDPLAERLVRLLLVLAVAGLQRSVGDIAAALGPSRPGWLEAVSQRLELLRTRGSYVTVERRPGDGADIYRVDVDFDANQVIRRHHQELLSALRAEDERLVGASLAACDSDDLPLATLAEPLTETCRWANTNRSVLVMVRDWRVVSPTEIHNRVALLAEPETAESVLVVLGSPVAPDAQAAAFSRLAAGLDLPRWRRALVAWLPRPMIASEAEAWREDVAFLLLRDDPTLVAGGEAVASRLAEELVERQARVRGLLARIYREGRLLTVDGEEPLAVSRWPELLRRAVEVALPQVFPGFQSLAPAQPLRSLAEVERLAAEFVLPGSVRLPAASPLAALITEVAAPLGLVEGEDGDFRLRCEVSGPARLMLDLVGEGSRSPSWLAGQLAKSEFGLPTGLGLLLLTALCRTGHLEPLDDRGQTVSLAVPLRSVAAALRVAPALPPERWQRLRELAEAIFGQLADQPLTAPTQRALLDRLLRWREAAGQSLAQLRAEVRETQQALGHEPLQWRRAEDACRQVAEVAAALAPDLPPRQLAEVFCDLTADVLPDRLAAAVADVRRLRSFLASVRPGLLAGQAFCCAVPLPPAHALAAAREQLLASLAAGDDLVFAAAELPQRLEAWRLDYQRAYLSWHAEAHADLRYQPYDAFRTGPLTRALANLSRLAIDAPDSLATVSEALRAERSKQCRRAVASDLSDELGVCPECQLPIGATVWLRPVDELAAEARRGIEELLAELRRPERVERIRRVLSDVLGSEPRLDAVESLLTETDPTPEQLVEWTGFQTIDLLNRALTQQPVATRRVADLAPRLVGKVLTRRQAREAFDQWLDPDRRLADDDPIALSE